MQSKACLDRRSSVAERVPRNADAWLRKKLCAVVRQARGADCVRRINHSVCKAVDACPALRLIETARRLETNACTQFKIRQQRHGVFEIPRAHGRAPAKFGRIRHHGEGFYRALQERCEACEGGLSELV